MSHIESDGGSESKRRGGCRADSCGRAATGEPPGIDDASEPWRVALQAGPGTLTPWPCGRTAALAIAARRNRARGHCRTPTRRSRRLGRQRKGVKGILAALAAAPPVSHSEATDRPLQLSYPTPAPGLRDAAPGRGRSCFGAGRSGGSLSLLPTPVEFHDPNGIFPVDVVFEPHASVGDTRTLGHAVVAIPCDCKHARRCSAPAFRFGLDLIALRRFATLIAPSSHSYKRIPMTTATTRW